MREDEQSPSFDDALMRAWVAGDVAAFETLHARHRGALQRYVRRLVGRAHAAWVDEIYQDTWLRVVHHREQWSPQGASFRTWLCTLAHHRAVDVLRKHGREAPLLATGDAERDTDSRDANEGATFEPQGTPWLAWPAAAQAVSDATPSPVDALFWRRAGEQLLQCLEQLPLAQKSVFLMHHDDGQPLDTIAQALGLGFETTKSRLRYAMSKLRTCMGAYLDPADTLGSR